MFEKTPTSEKASISKEVMSAPEGKILDSLKNLILHLEYLKKVSATDIGKAKAHVVSVRAWWDSNKGTMDRDLSRYFDSILNLSEFVPAPTVITPTISLLTQSPKGSSLISTTLIQSPKVEVKEEKKVCTSALTLDEIGSALRQVLTELYGAKTASEMKVSVTSLLAEEIQKSLCYQYEEIIAEPDGYVENLDTEGIINLKAEPRSELTKIFAVLLEKDVPVELSARMLIHRLLKLVFAQTLTYGGKTGTDITIDTYDFYRVLLHDRLLEAKGMPFGEYGNLIGFFSGGKKDIAYRLVLDLLDTVPGINDMPEIKFFFGSDKTMENLIRTKEELEKASFSHSFFNGLLSLVQHILVWATNLGYQDLINNLERIAGTKVSKEELLPRLSVQVLIIQTIILRVLKVIQRVGRPELGPVYYFDSIVRAIQSDDDLLAMIPFDVISNSKSIK